MSLSLIKFLYYLSWAFSIVLATNILLAILNRLLKQICRKVIIPNKHNRSFKAKLLVASLFLIGAVWSLRFAVGYYMAFNPPEGSVPLTPVEEIFNSFVHTLQTFSLDEDYTEYIAIGREMMTAAFGEGAKPVDVYGVYAAVLNFLVPVAGGAIVFEIISEFSPGMRLLFANCRIWTKKYYFSELNDNSLALAKNIVDIDKGKVCIVFTDAYADDEEEKGSERLATAKSFGAICLRDDLMTIKISGKAPKIFLIDGSEISNLQALTALLDRKSKRIRNSEIFVFSSDKKYSNIDEDVAFIVNQRKETKEEKHSNNDKDVACSDNQGKKTKGKKHSNNAEDVACSDNQTKKTEKMPTVIPVNGIRNMACNLFERVPLYEPLVNEKPTEERTLTVTILGSGVIGTEFFLTTYWCGQMSNCKLHINVVSKERQNKDSKLNKEGDFEGRINCINPDILNTADPDSELLRYSDDKEPVDPYFLYKYKESDVLSDDFVTLMKESGLLDTDYFIVALGSDEDNLEAANKLRQIVGVHHMYSAPKKKTVISYVIYNSDLCCALNRKQKYYYVPNNTDDKGNSVPDIFMNAFGDLDSVYSVKNVFMEDISNSAFELQKTYDLQKGMKEAEKKRKDDKNERFKDIYSYQSNVAKRFHRKYKVFSAELIKTGVFSGGTEAKDADKEFRDFITEMPKNETIECFNKTKKEILDELAWLEHRRWCAYLRTKGFTDPGKSERGDYRYAEYFNVDNAEHTSKEAHKFISLKLHPCLVECSKHGIESSRFDDRGFLITESEVLQIPSHDYLDDLSNDRAKRKNEAENFKKWDYPEFDLESDKISEEIISGSKPFDISGIIDPRSIYLSGNKKYISVSCFAEKVKERYKSFICETQKSISKEVAGKITKSDDFNKTLNKAMNEIIVTVKPFSEVDVEMIEYNSKVNQYSNQLLETLCQRAFCCCCSIR